MATKGERTLIQEALLCEVGVGVEEREEADHSKSQT